MRCGPEVLKQLCDHATTLLEAGGAAVWRVDGGGRFMLVAASDDHAARLGRCQGGGPDGPTARAGRSRQVVVVDDLACAEWPQLRCVARELGVSSMVAMPISVGGKVIGALAIHRTTRGTWSGRDLCVARVVTEMAGVLMSVSSDLDRAAATIEQQRSTLETRAVIEQAKGMISRDHHVSVDVAFEMLRRHSRNTNTPVRVLARAVTDMGMQIPVTSSAPPRHQRQRVGRSEARTGAPDFGAERS